MADTNKAAQPGAAKKPEEEKKQEKPVVEELNEEDQLLKEKLELLVERLTDKDKAQRVNALD